MDWGVLAELVSNPEIWGGALIVARAAESFFGKRKKASQTEEITRLRDALKDTKEMLNTALQLSTNYRLDLESQRAETKKLEQLLLARQQSDTNGQQNSNEDKGKTSNAENG